MIIARPQLYMKPAVPGRSSTILFYSTISEQGTMKLWLTSPPLPLSVNSSPRLETVRTPGAVVGSSTHEGPCK